MFLCFGFATKTILQVCSSTVKGHTLPTVQVRVDLNLPRAFWKLALGTVMAEFCSSLESQFLKIAC